jgi:hypothetical protein
MCTQYLHNIHPPSPFPYLLPTPTGSNSPGTTCSLILYKEKRRRKWHFWLFKIATWGVSLWHFICIIAQFGSSPLFFFFLPYFLSYSGFNQFTNCIFILCRKCINHLHLLNFLVLLSPSHMQTPLGIINLNKSKKLSTKCTVPQKAILQKWRGNNIFSIQAKAKAAHHHYALQEMLNGNFYHY